LGSTPSIAPVAATAWPAVRIRDVDCCLHKQNLLQEARLLKAFSNNYYKKKRTVFNLTAIAFLDLIIAYLDTLEAKNNQD
jgi:hypothetical protein